MPLDKKPQLITLKYEIGFNGRLLIELLKQTPGTHVQLRMSAPNRACLIHPHDGEPNTRHTALLMPVMLTQSTNY